MGAGSVDIGVPKRVAAKDQPYSATPTALEGQGMRAFLFSSAMIVALSLLGACSSPLIMHGTDLKVVQPLDTLGGGPTQ